MKTRAGSLHSGGASFPVTPRFPHAACERLSSSIFQDDLETRGAQRPDGGGGERIRRGLSGCREGKAAGSSRKGDKQASPG